MDGRCFDSLTTLLLLAAHACDRFRIRDDPCHFLRIGGQILFLKDKSCSSQRFHDGRLIHSHHGHALEHGLDQRDAKAFMLTGAKKSCRMPYPERGHAVRHFSHETDSLAGPTHGVGQLAHLLSVCATAAVTPA